MTREQVNFILGELHQAFGGREYSAKQIEVIHELSTRYGARAFRLVAKRLLEDGDRKPQIKDFKQQLQNLPRDLRPPVSESVYEIQCNHCLDTGKVFVKREFVEFNGLPVMAFCKCPIGKMDAQKTGGLAEFDLSHFGLVDDFLPTFELLCGANRHLGPLESKSDNNMIPILQGAVDRWNYVIKNSAMYWKKENHINRIKKG